MTRQIMDGYNLTEELNRLGSGLAGNRRPRLDLLQGRLQRHRRRLPFLLCVVLPTLLGAIYYLLIASDQYISEAEFVIRSPGHSGGSVTGGGALATLLQGSGLNRSQDDTYSVNDYILSREALQDLIKDDDLRAVYNRPEADFLARFPGWLHFNTSVESFYKYYQNHVDVLYDTTTGLTTIDVRTFRPQDSQRIANALLQAGERQVNELNERALNNAVRDAQREVARMEDRVRDVETRISAFRNQETVIDPAKQSQMLLTGVAELERQLAQTETLIDQLHQSSPNSPLLPTAERRAEAIRDQIAEQQGRVTGGGDSMVPRLERFEQLQLEESFAEKGLTAATASLETARLEAERQQLYLDRVVQPNLPDYPLYPRRMVFIAIVFATFFSLYLIGKMFVAGVKEHQAH